jgi:hypothetical protein
VKEGWYEDPSDRHDYRWFSSGSPTDLVRDGLITSSDPISITEPAAFEAMELKRPPDPARLHGAWISRAAAAVVAVFFAAIAWAGYWWLTSSVPPARPVSYLLTARSSLVFIQWHEATSSGDLTGTITYANLSGRPPAETVAVESNHLTGQWSPGGEIDNDIDPSVSLNVLDGNFASGTFQGSKLVFNDPGGAGSGGSTYVFVRSDPAAYNAALRALTAQVQRANKLAASRH